jgi:hypothetical protein
MLAHKVFSIFKTLLGLSLSQYTGNVRKNCGIWNAVYESRHRLAVDKIAVKIFPSAVLY